MDTDETHSNASIRDDLNNYRDDLPVYVRDMSGNLREIGYIHADGDVLVIEMGERRSA